MIDNTEGGRALAGWGGARKAYETRKSCDLPEVPQPLDGEGPHAAPGATAVLVRAASVAEKRRGWSVSRVGRKAEQLTRSRPILVRRTEMPPLHFTNQS